MPPGAQDLRPASRRTVYRRPGRGAKGEYPRLGEDPPGVRWSPHLGFGAACLKRLTRDVPAEAGLERRKDRGMRTLGRPVRRSHSFFTSPSPHRTLPGCRWSSSKREAAPTSTATSWRRSTIPARNGAWKRFRSVAVPQFRRSVWAGVHLLDQPATGTHLNQLPHLGRPLGQPTGIEDFGQSGTRSPWPPPWSAPVHANNVQA